MAQCVKDLASQQWLVFDPWLGTFTCCRHSPPRKKSFFLGIFQILFSLLQVTFRTLELDFHSKSKIVQEGFR